MADHIVRRFLVFTLDVTMRERDKLIDVAPEALERYVAKLRANEAGHRALECHGFGIDLDGFHAMVELRVMATSGDAPQSGIYDLDAIAKDDPHRAEYEAINRRIAVLAAGAPILAEQRTVQAPPDLGEILEAGSLGGGLLR